MDADDRRDGRDRRRASRPPPVPAATAGAPGEPSDQAAVLAAAGKTAEAGGDLEKAEQAYWRAASIEAEPALRANYLVAHARVLLARGDVETARGQLESARERAPGHVGASALLADISYRTQDWARARELYTLLDSAPSVTDVLPREVLVQRRAMLADRFGDADEAEALYRELAILNPQHLGARKALSELARARGDLPGAAQRLEEVLRLMPSDTSGELLDIRQRLGAMYAELGRMGGGPPLPGAGARAGSGARARAGAAARGVRSPRDAGRGGQGLRAPGPPVLRTVTARRRPLSPGGDPARSAGQSVGRAGRVPAVFGPRSAFRSVAPAAGRSLLERRRSGRRRRAGERPQRGPAVGGQRAGADRPPGDRDDDAARGRHVALPVHARAGSGRRARDRRGRRPPGADR